MKFTLTDISRLLCWWLPVIFAALQIQVVDSLCSIDVKVPAITKVGSHFVWSLLINNKTLEPQEGSIVLNHEESFSGILFSGIR